MALVLHSVVKGNQTDPSTVCPAFVQMLIRNERFYYSNINEYVVQHFPQSIESLLHQSYGIVQEFRWQLLQLSICRIGSPNSYPSQPTSTRFWCLTLDLPMPNFNINQSVTEEPASFADICHKICCVEYLCAQLLSCTVWCIDCIVILYEKYCIILYCITSHCIVNCMSCVLCCVSLYAFLLIVLAYFMTICSTYCSFCSQNIDCVLSDCIPTVDEKFVSASVL